MSRENEARERHIQRLDIAWHTLIQWLASRNELEMWMDDVLASNYNGWFGSGRELEPHSKQVREVGREPDFFNWPSTTGSEWKHWRDDWRAIYPRLWRELDTPEMQERMANISVE